MLKITLSLLILVVSIVVVKSNNILEQNARLNPSAVLPGTASEASLRNLLRNPNPLLTPSSAAVTLHKQSENHGTGDFRYSFENSDGTKAEQVGYLKPGNELNTEGIQAVQGSYSYVSPEGVPVTVNYVADENGFRASGDHIPSGGHETVRRNTELGFLNNPELAATAGVDPNLIRQSLALGNKRLPFLGNRNNPALTRELLIQQLNGNYNGNYNGLDRGFPALGLGLGGQLGGQYPYNRYPLGAAYPQNAYNRYPLGTSYPQNGYPLGTAYPQNRYPLASQYPYNRYPSGSQYSQYPHNLYNPHQSIYNQRFLQNPYVNQYQQGIGLGLGSTALRHPELAHVNSNRLFP